MVEEKGTSILPIRAWRAWRERGTAYIVHKALRRGLSGRTDLKRRLVYHDPRSYWTLRGGLEYFREQEDHPTRGDRARVIARSIAAYQPTSILEVGCGYGKQLRELRRQLPQVPLTGIDFSPSQLAMARKHLEGLDAIDLALASGTRLPFVDGAFDLVLTSAVILHNPPPQAERIRREVVRVSRRLAALNEDTNTSYNRYGYDTAAWYRDRGIPVLESGPIGVATDPDHDVSQFCVVETWRR